MIPEFLRYFFGAGQLMLLTLDWPTEGELPFPCFCEVVHHFPEVPPPTEFNLGCYLSTLQLASTRGVPVRYFFSNRPNPRGERAVPGCDSIFLTLELLLYYFQ